MRCGIQQTHFLYLRDPLPNPALRLPDVEARVPRAGAGGVPPPVVSRADRAGRPVCRQAGRLPPHSTLVGGSSCARFQLLCHTRCRINFSKHCNMRDSFAFCQQSSANTIPHLVRCGILLESAAANGRGAACCAQCISPAAHRGPKRIGRPCSTAHPFSAARPDTSVHEVSAYALPWHLFQCAKGSRHEKCHTTHQANKINAPAFVDGASPASRSATPGQANPACLTQNNRAIAKSGDPGLLNPTPHEVWDSANAFPIPPRSTAKPGAALAGCGGARPAYRCRRRPAACCVAG